MDAESETLVNQALSRLLQGNNTTISIAHRLSTIQRSDTIICIGADGTIAEIGSYRELSANPDGAFSKLMEWQMNGGDVPSPKTASEPDPGLTEEERMRAKLEERHGEEEEAPTPEELAEEEALQDSKVRSKR